MLSFLRRSPPRYPSVRQALQDTGLPYAAASASLAVLHSHGSYSGRRVNFFRAYDPARAAALAIPVHGYSDLDTHQDLVLGSGHVEREGLVMVNSQPEQDQAVPMRSAADRAAHLDDARFVFWDAETARASGEPLSAPAAAWLQAQSTAGPNGGA